MNIHLHDGYHNKDVQAVLVAASHSAKLVDDLSHELGSSYLAESEENQGHQSF